MVTRGGGTQTHKVEQGLGVLALRIKTLLMVEKFDNKRGSEETISFLLALSNWRP